MLYIARGILRDQSLAEDAVSDAFVRIINNLHKINMDDCYKTKGFVVVIVRNVSLNILKQQAREKTIPLEDYIDYADCGALSSICSPPGRPARKLPAIASLTGRTPIFFT